MRALQELLGSILGQTTFDSPPAKNMSPALLRDFFERDGLHDEKITSARKVQPKIPDELLLQLKNHLRPLLEEYIDPEMDLIGHAFPIDERGYPISRIRPEWREIIYHLDHFDLAYISRVSAVEDFAKGLIKGAAVVGSERVTHLLSGWLQEEPVTYRTSAILNGLPVNAPFTPVDGVHIESLPLSTDRLVASLPRRPGMSAVDYLGRTLVSIESEVKPALFHPKTRPSAQNIQVEPIGGVSIDTVCQALSLESDGYVDAGFYWNDYQELTAFSLGVDETTWSMGNARVRSQPAPMTWRTDLFTNVTTLELKCDQRMLDLPKTQLARTLEALKTLKNFDTRIAVSRWVKSKDSGEQLADRFIDLRIALECLYLQAVNNENDRGEKRFRLSLTGAWHLGDDLEERKRIRRKLGKAYDAASAAVHGGDFKNEDKKQELLSDAQDLCRRGILKLLKEGAPRDWGDLILGSEENANSV